MMLEVGGLTKSFGGLIAVKNFDFQVAEKELIGLIGPNGSGKTTVFKRWVCKNIWRRKIEQKQVSA